MRAVPVAFGAVPAVASAAATLRLHVSGSASSEYGVSPLPNRVALGQSDAASASGLAAVRVPNDADHIDAFTVGIDIHNVGDTRVVWMLVLELTRSGPISQAAVSTSTDNGNTWADPVDIDVSGNPAICVLPPLAPQSLQTVLLRVSDTRAQDETPTRAYALTVDVAAEHRAGRRRRRGRRLMYSPSGA